MMLHLHLFLHRCMQVNVHMRPAMSVMHAMPHAPVHAVPHAPVHAVPHALVHVGVVSFATHHSLAF